MRLNRRGNALILVAAVLVLLVIIATVFLSRTATLRQVSASQRRAAFQTDRMESAAEEIAQEIATSLFVHPIDYTDDEYWAGLPVDEGRRRRPDPDAVRYGVDERFAWNRAPYEVSAWTNPPDWLSWPLRPGPWHAIYDEGIERDQRQWNWHEYRESEGSMVDLFHWPLDPLDWPFHATDTVLPLRQNPIGGPGISDTRWLRDIEPQRMASASLNNLNPASELSNPFQDRFLDGFSHWRHLSYIGRPQNGWRMCPDIADVTGVRSSMTPDGIRHNADDGWLDGRRYYGGILDRLDLPIEQWPAALPARGLGLAGGFERLTDMDTVDGDTATSNFVFDDESLVIPMTADPQAFPDAVRSDDVWDFWDRWLAWLRPEGQRLALNAAEQGVGGSLPPNFYDLSDLDGDGMHGEIFDPSSVPGPDNPSPTSLRRWGERPEDEFTPGTARWNVSRILTDTDGDGFTDSFWWLSPHIGVDGTRQVIGVSITDNSGRLNANAATRFIRNDQAATKESSRGSTPADLALVGQNHGVIEDSDDYGPSNFTPQAPVWNTGFFDIEAHQPYLYEVGTTHQAVHPDLTVPLITFPESGEMTGEPSEVFAAWDPDFWREYDSANFNSRALIDQLNLRLSPILPDDIADANDRENRLAYFQMSGQDPQHPQNVFTPFNLSDELELRASEGANHPWVDSQFERATGVGTNTYGVPNDVNLLRGLTIRGETSESGDQLDNRQLSFDLRHRMTFFSGARNETLPPHLWWEYRAPLPRADDIVYGGANVPTSIDDPLVEALQDRFAEQNRLKLDLREYERPVPSMPAMQAEYGPKRFSQRLAHALMLGLTSGDVTDRDWWDAGQNAWVEGKRDSYFGKGDAAWEQTRRMAAAMAANMLAARDTDDDAPIYTMEGYHPLIAQDTGVPVRGWFGDTGAVPLPIFEEPYDPETGDLFLTGDDLNGNTMSDFIDLSDAASRPPRGQGLGSPAPVLPWDLYDYTHPEEGWSEQRLYAGHDDWTGRYSPEVHELGVEAQPFIAEAFVAVVGRPWQIPSPGNDPDQPPSNAPIYQNHGDWLWATTYEPYTENGDGDYNSVIAPLGAAREYFADEDVAPVAPRVIFAVQLLNPYDVALPLLDRNGEPIYSLRLLRPDRLDPSVAETWTIPIDPRGTADGGELDFKAATSLDGGTNLPNGSVNLDTVPLLPPATHDRPYSLMIVMNGVEETTRAEQFEAARWLDFLDAEAAMHPSDDTFENPYWSEGDDAGLRTRTIAGGELIWSIKPDFSVDVDGDFGTSVPSLARDWYPPNVGGGASMSYFKGPLVDPKQGVAIELVRRHQRDWNDGGTVDQSDPLKDYQVDLVIDRTVGADGVDEFAHAMTTQLALHRQPSIQDTNSPPQPPNNENTTLFPSQAEFVVAMEAAEGSTTDRSISHSWLYPMPLRGVQATDDRTASVGWSSLDDSLRIPPEKARWMHWARFSRSWAVDDWEAQRDSVEDLPEDLEPKFSEAEYAVELDWDASTPPSSRRWRPDRAAPRFVSADARVTRSWARPWATQLGEMPNLHDSLAYSTDDDGTQYPSFAFPFAGAGGGQHVLHNATFSSEVPPIGPPDPGGAPGLLGLTASEDPLLVDDNLPSLQPAKPEFVQGGAYGIIDFSNPPLRLDRRYAEQKGLIPSDGSVSNADGDLTWPRWMVSVPSGDEGPMVPRDLRVMVQGDPENDTNLPRSALLFDGDLDNDFPATPPEFLPPEDFRTDWGVGWFRTGASENSVPFNGGEGVEVADTYATLLRYRHGNIFHVDWDPDGLGRMDTDGDGDWDSVGDAYTFDNPYPHPWATRNARLPWSFSTGQPGAAPETEYRIFEAAKPSFFAFAPRRNVGGTLLSLDAGYDGDSTTFDWSYPDKGWYGPREIDGDTLMPHGFQVNLKNANFEQVGEVLNALTVAHELYIPLQQSVEPPDPFEIFPGGPGWFAWPPEPQVIGPSGPLFEDPWVFPPHPDSGQVDGIVTLQTFSEGIAELAEAGAGPAIGRLELGRASDQLNAVVGDQPYVLSEDHPTDPENAPWPWYLAADDPAHFEPDLPAAQRLADLFVCDGPGIWDLETNQDNATHNQGDFYPDGFIDDRGSYARFTSTFGGVSAAMPRNPAFDNAAGFRGDPTRGLININTAPVEVLRAMPHMYRLVHADPSFGGHPSILDDGVTTHDLDGPISPHPRSGVPEAVVQYRDGLGKRPRFANDVAWPDLMVPGTGLGPAYGDRGSGEGSLSIDAWYDAYRGNWDLERANLQTDAAVQYARGMRGFAAIGELFQLSRPALAGFEVYPDVGEDYRDPLGSALSADAWRMDWAARNPFGYQDEQVHGQDSDDSRMWDARDAGLLPEHRRSLADVGAFLSTDTGRLFDSQVPDLRTAEYVAAGTWGNPIDNDPLLTITTAEPRYQEVHLTGDRVAADAEEASLLFSGISNLITTRSDMFTVHLRVRTFKQDPDTGVWDATDPNAIVADERFVMVVDRSNVERPGDRPRILLMDRVDH